MPKLCQRLALITIILGSAYPVQAGSLSADAGGIIASDGRYGPTLALKSGNFDFGTRPKTKTVVSLRADFHRRTPTGEVRILRDLGFVSSINPSINGIIGIGAGSDGDLESLDWIMGAEFSENLGVFISSGRARLRHCPDCQENGEVKLEANYARRTRATELLTTAHGIWLTRGTEGRVHRSALGASLAVKFFVLPRRGYVSGSAIYSGSKEGLIDVPGLDHWDIREVAPSRFEGRIAVGIH